MGLPELIPLWFCMLEPCDGQLSCTVLRGEDYGDIFLLPDLLPPASCLLPPACDVANYMLGA